MVQVIRWLLLRSPINFEDVGFCHLSLRPFDRYLPLAVLTLSVILIMPLLSNPHIGIPFWAIISSLPQARASYVQHNTSESGRSLVRPALAAAFNKPDRQSHIGGRWGLYPSTSTAIDLDMYRPAAEIVFWILLDHNLAAAFVDCSKSTMQQEHQ